MKLNSYQDYNENNLGIVKMKIKYPDLSEEEIYTKVFGRTLKRPVKNEH